ncbi:hypothetical protein ACWC3X_27745 [Streptomyces populi]
MLSTPEPDATAEAVHEAMLTHPEEDVTALAARLDLTGDQVRSALDRLSELALVHPSSDPVSLR